MEASCSSSSHQRRPPPPPAWAGAAMASPHAQPTAQAMRTASHPPSAVTAAACVHCQPAPLRAETAWSVSHQRRRVFAKMRPPLCRSPAPCVCNWRQCLAGSQSVCKLPGLLRLVLTGGGGDSRARTYCGAPARTAPPPSASLRLPLPHGPAALPQFVCARPCAPVAPPQCRFWIVQPARWQTQ